MCTSGITIKKAFTECLKIYLKSVLRLHLLKYTANADAVQILGKFCRHANLSPVKIHSLEHYYFFFFTFVKPKCKVF